MKTSLKIVAIVIGAIALFTGGSIATASDTNKTPNPAITWDRSVPGPVPTPMRIPAPIVFETSRPAPKPSPETFRPPKIVFETSKPAPKPTPMRVQPTTTGCR